MNRRFAAKLESPHQPAPEIVKALPAIYYDHQRYLARVEMLIHSYMREINAREGRPAIDFLDARCALLGCVAL